RFGLLIRGVRCQREGVGDAQQRDEHIGDTAAGRVRVRVRIELGDAVADQRVHGPAFEGGRIDRFDGLSMSGWWLNTRSASSTTASAMTASMGSRANRIDRTSASGSPTAN